MGGGGRRTEEWKKERKRKEGTHQLVALYLWFDGSLCRSLVSKLPLTDVACYFSQELSNCWLCGFFEAAFLQSLHSNADKRLLRTLSPRHLSISAIKGQAHLRPTLSAGVFFCIGLCSTSKHVPMLTQPFNIISFLLWLNCFCPSETKSHLEFLSHDALGKIISGIQLFGVLWDVKWTVWRDFHRFVQISFSARVQIKWEFCAFKKVLSEIYS